MDGGVMNRTDIGLGIAFLVLAFAAGLALGGCWL
jgi:hypothetical protein